MCVCLWSGDWGRRSRVELDGFRGEILSQNWKVFDLRMLMLLRLWMSLTLVSKGFFPEVFVGLGFGKVSGSSSNAERID